MSLDVCLTLPGQSGEKGSGIYVREGGQTREISREEWDAKFPGLEPLTIQGESEDVYHDNITHNLGKMADAAGVYMAMWRPDELNIKFASDLIPLLRNGLSSLEDNPEHYKQFNPENGWGNYEGLVSFVRKYLEACERYPAATVYASR